MAKIIAKLEGEKFLVEMNILEIQKLNIMRAGYNNYQKIFKVGEEFPITSNIESLQDRIKKLTSISAFHNLKKDINEVLHTIEKLEEENKKWQQEKH